MRVLRRRSGFVVLALIALATQILCSAWHTHSHEASGPFSFVLAQASVPAAPETEQQVGPHDPAGPHDDDEGGCTLCWIIALAAAALLGPILAPLGAGLGGGTPLPPCGFARLHRPAAASFRARAPPLKRHA